MKTPLARWEIQRRTRVGWTMCRSGTAEGVEERDLAAAALACHLMTVDHDSDLADYRAVVRYQLRRAHVLISEGDLADYLCERGYYPTPGQRPILRDVLDPAACKALPLGLQAQADREGAPGPR
ncbi:hypothetical protein G6W57_00630 [Streptomyces sp. CAI-121]|uniref:hypothetical protein n=1 Tax=unclassified Streptomyces TaxID=2593676 RepID=UPI0015878442|nr:MULTISPECIES: hypothetical protein [unclassified Streptomyces]NUV65621.1 hypothetical protein [Streptomyces sp. CAI-121]NUW12358.1 hypothetical protein [Streptomyces sp. CAI-68]